MIFDASTSGASREPCLTDYVSGLFAPTDTHDGLNEMTVREVASALEAYATAEGGNMIETTNLVALASSAVRALGRDDLAVEAAILGSGIVYSQTLACVEDAPVWVIDTGRLFPDMPSCTELGFFSVLYHLVGSMVHLWDSSSGRGALGIKKLRLIAKLFAGKKGGAKGVDLWTGKIRDTVHERLVQASSGRGWTSVPRVLMLD
jgi:hypothetical protein